MSRDPKKEEKRKRRKRIIVTIMGVLVVVGALVVVLVDKIMRDSIKIQLETKVGEGDFITVHGGGCCGGGIKVKDAQRLKEVCPGLRPIDFLTLFEESLKMKNAQIPHEYNQKSLELAKQIRDWLAMRKSDRNGRVVNGTTKK